MAKDIHQETHYQTLQVLPSATQFEIKAAYRRLLLSLHPDKRNFSADQKTVETGLLEEFDVTRIQEAYRILSDVDERAVYDASLSRSKAVSDAPANVSRPRPAQVISLEEFSSVDSENSSFLQWCHACRCGGTYCITEEDMEEDRHIIACDQCSEVVYVGYEALEDEEDHSTVTTSANAWECVDISVSHLALL